MCVHALPNTSSYHSPFTIATHNVWLWSNNHRSPKVSLLYGTLVGAVDRTVTHFCSSPHPPGELPLRSTTTDPSLQISLWVDFFSAFWDVGRLLAHPVSWLGRLPLCPVINQNIILNVTKSLLVTILHLCAPPEINNKD